MIIIVAVYQPQLYSSLSLLLSVCVCVCMNFFRVYDNSKKWINQVEFEHLVVYGNCSGELDIGHCIIMVKVMA